MKEYFKETEPDVIVEFWTSSSDKNSNQRLNLNRHRLKLSEVDSFLNEKYVFDRYVDTMIIFREID